MCSAPPLADGGIERLPVVDSNCCDPLRHEENGIKYSGTTLILSNQSTLIFSRFFHCPTLEGVKDVLLRPGVSDKLTAVPADKV
jgi:hypothetical protein